MKKGNKINPSLNVQKIRQWANHGETSEQIAGRLGVTVEILNEMLNDLAQKNRKSAQAIFQLLSRNDKQGTKPQSSQKTKPQRTKANAAPAAPKPPATPSTTPTQTKSTTPKTESSRKATPITQVISSDAESLEFEIRKLQHELQAIDDSEASANAIIEERKQSILLHEQKLKQLFVQVKAEKEALEDEQRKLDDAKNTLIACSGRRPEKEKLLAELQAQLLTSTKPEIYVCNDGEIQCENVEIPENINVSQWAKLIEILPEEIGENLRKKDAELLIRLRAIVASIKRDDTELVFESETIEAAYKALDKIKLPAAN